MCHVEKILFKYHFFSNNDDKWSQNNTIETTILVDSRTVNLPLQINRDSVHETNSEDSAANSFNTQPKYKTMPASASLGTGIMLNDIPEKQIGDDENVAPRINDINDLSRRSAEPESPRHFQTQMNERLKQLEQKSQQLLEHRSNMQKTSEEYMVSVSRSKVFV